jgi:hypothetical protein
MTNIEGAMDCFFTAKDRGIGWHGDGERDASVGASINCLRLGYSNPMAFRWYYKSLPVENTNIPEMRSSHVSNETFKLNNEAKKNKAHRLEYKIYEKHAKNGKTNYFMRAPTFNAVLNHGDLYFMSEEAIGTQWKVQGTYRGPHHVPHLSSHAVLHALFKSAIPNAAQLVLPDFVVP